jgi:NmrA-like family
MCRLVHEPQLSPCCHAGPLQGMYGAFVNTDVFTVGEQKEVYAGMRVFEAAKKVGILRHFIWSGGPYSTWVIPGGL